MKVAIEFYFIFTIVICKYYNLCSMERKLNNYDLPALTWLIILPT